MKTTPAILTTFTPEAQADIDLLFPAYAEPVCSAPNCSGDFPATIQQGDKLVCLAHKRPSRIW